MISTPIAKAAYVTAALCLPPSIRALSTRLNMDQETISKHCKALESLGWMKLTKEGRSLRPSGLVLTESRPSFAAETRSTILDVSVQGRGND